MDLQQKGKHEAMYELMPYQSQGVDFLRHTPYSYLADDAGLGKTRQVLASVNGPVTVVTTACIRDAKVWTNEATAIGWDHPLTVISYQQLARLGTSGSDLASLPRTLIFDEAHRLKNRQVSWHKPAKFLARNAQRVHLLSGTPIPNQASELWAQLVLLRSMPAYWPWVRRWFVIETSPWSSFSVTNRLRDCSSLCGKDCEHWQEFHQENLAGIWLRRERDLVLKDLPPITGEATPLHTPMGLTQGRAYKELKKAFLADLPDGARLSALTHSDRFLKLWKLSTGLGSALPGSVAGPAESSSKLALIADLLADRSHPTFLVNWFRSTGTLLGELLEDMGLPYGIVNGETSAAERRRIFDKFQSGSLRALIGSVGVVAEGITLTAADEVIMVERSWVPSQNEQVIRRLHRIGQTRPVTVRQLVTPKSVDALQWKALTDKQTGIDPVLSVRELNRTI